MYTTKGFVGFVMTAVLLLLPPKDVEAVPCSMFSVPVPEAERCLMQEDYAGAYTAYREADLQRPLTGKDLYNAACAAAVVGYTDQAFDYLGRRLAEDSLWYPERIEADRDLVGLHDDTRWQRLLDTVRQRRLMQEKNFDTVLRNTLQAMFDSDQQIRQQYVYARDKQAPQHRLDSLLEAMVRIDSMNLAEMTSLLDGQGWPSRQRAGTLSAVPFLILQHAPLEIRLKYLPLVRKAARAGDLQPSQTALFEDRIAVEQGRRQRYGTQILWVDGTPSVAPLVSRDSVDFFRADVGLPPMAEYVRRWGIVWEP